MRCGRGSLMEWEWIRLCSRLASLVSIALLLDVHVVPELGIGYSYSVSVSVPKGVSAPTPLAITRAMRPDRTMMDLIMGRRTKD